MEFRLLGPLEVVEHDRVLAVGGGKQRALLAVLLLHANEVVSNDRLLDDLWGSSPPATATKSIQVYVSRLRKELGDARLITRMPGYLLRIDRSELDVARFEQLVGEARIAEGGAGRAQAAQGARPLAGTAAGRPCLRAVRAGRDRPTRGAAARRARPAHRGRPGRRAAHAARERARGAGGRAPAARKAVDAADAGAVPVGHGRPRRSRPTAARAACSTSSSGSTLAPSSSSSTSRYSSTIRRWPSRRRPQSTLRRRRPRPSGRCSSRRRRWKASTGCWRSRNRWRRHDRRANWSSPPWCRPPT